MLSSKTKWHEYPQVNDALKLNQTEQQISADDQQKKEHKPRLQKAGAKRCKWKTFAEKKAVEAFNDLL